MADSTTSPSAPPLLVACLCAEWCGICRDYRPLMQAALAELGAAPPAVAWVDIEDHDEVLGEFDVQSFPTLLIVRGDQPLFFGAVTPHAQTLQRLVQGAQAGGMAPLVADAELLGLVERVQAFHAAAP
jgi:thioredoxin 1